LSSANVEDPDGAALGMLVEQPGRGRLAVVVIRVRDPIDFHLPARPGQSWLEAAGGIVTLPGRSVGFDEEAAVSAGPAADP
jgi:hypothetical protein